jgi:hypothetical protein
VISTVTTTTTTTVTTVAGVVATLGLAATIFLIVFLTAKELTPARGKGTFRIFGRNLDIAIIPLLLVFTMIVVMKVIEVL